MYTILHQWYRKHANQIVKNQSQTLACVELHWQALEINQSILMWTWLRTLPHFLPNMQRSLGFFADEPTVHAAGSTTAGSSC